MATALNRHNSCLPVLELHHHQLTMPTTGLLNSHPRAVTSDSHYAMVCFMFLGQPSTLAAMVSPLLFAALRLASYIKRNFPAVARPVLPLIDAALARKVRLV